MDSPEVGGCKTGDPEPPFPALRGKDRNKQQTETENPGSQHCMEKGITAAGHVQRGKTECGEQWESPRKTEISVSFYVHNYMYIYRYI